MKLPEFFGLDIGNHTIKIAQVKYSGDKAVLEKLGNIDTPFGVVGNEDPVAITQLADSVKEIRKATGIKTDKVVAALPESVIFSRVMEIPFTKDEGKIEETIFWEAKQHIPIPVENVQLDWLQIQEKTVEGNKMLQVLLVAAPKKIVEQYKTLADKAGLELIALETESVATARILSYKKNYQKPLLILDFGSQGTDMSVIKGSSLIFAQSLGTGSDALTKAIANDYGIPEQQAEQYKRAYGLLEDQGEGKIANTLKPVMEIIINEINKTVNYFKAHLQESTPQGIFIVGDGAKLLGLEEYMTQRIGIPTKVANPLEQIQVPKSLQNDVDQLATVGFTVAVGLAMKTE